MRESKSAPLITALEKFRKKRQKERMMDLQGSRLPTNIQGESGIKSFNRFLDTEEGIEQRKRDKEEHPELFLGSDSDSEVESNENVNDPPEEEKVIEESDPKQKISKKERSDLQKIRGKKDKVEDLDLENF